MLAKFPFTFSKIKKIKIDIANIIIETKMATIFICFFDLINCFKLIKTGIIKIKL